MEDSKIIRKGDTVLHQLSGLYFICENTKMERWMNMNPFYIWQPSDVVPPSYHSKNL